MTGQIFNPWRKYYAVSVPQGLLSYNGLTNSAKLCWAKLVQYAGERGFSYPSHDQLSQDMGLSKRQIVNLLHELEQKKFIFVKRPTGKERYFHRNNTYYFLDHPCFSDLPVQEADPKGYVQSISPRVGGLGETEFTSYVKDPSDSVVYHKESLDSLETSKGEFEKKISKVIDYWQEKNLYQSAPKTKGVKRDIETVRRLLDGSAFEGTEFSKENRSYTVREIKSAIDNFAIAAFDKAFLPVEEKKKRLQKMSIADFVYHPFVKLATFKSQFLYFLGKDPTPTRTPEKPIEDKVPELTRALKNLYIKEVLGGVDCKFLEKEENQFRLAAQKAVEFAQANKKRFSFHTVLRPATLASWMIRAAEKDKGSYEITPGWLCSDRMFSLRLPSYLVSQAILKKGDNGTRVGRIED